MIPQKTIEELIIKHSKLEKDLKNGLTEEYWFVKSKIRSENKPVFSKGIFWEEYILFK